MLLCHVQQHVQPPQQPSLPSSIGTPVVQSWLRHFQTSWGAMLPPQLLMYVPAAIAAPQGASTAPQQHPGSSQAYKLLLPEHCLEEAPSAAAGDCASSSSSRGRGRRPMMPCMNVHACVKFVFAAAAVLGPDSTPEDVCKLVAHSPGMQRVPLLLLASAVAVPVLMSPAALHVGSRIAATARQLLSASWCGGTDVKPCTVCAELLGPIAWHSVGLASLHMQQITAQADVLITQRTSGGSTSSSCGSTSTTGSSSSVGPAAGTTAAGQAAWMGVDNWIPIGLWTAGYLLQSAVSCGVLRAISASCDSDFLQLTQLQQLSLALQRTEAAARAFARRQRLLPEGIEAFGAETAAAMGAVSADSADIIRPGPMLCPTVELCRVAVSAVRGDDGDVNVGVQLVLQSSMSLLLTLLSTGQGKPGAAVPVLAAVVHLQDALALHEQVAAEAADAAAAAAAAADSQAVAAGWFVLGRCLLHLSEQLQLCATQPGSYPLSAWLLMSAQVRDHMRDGSSGTTVVSGETLEAELIHFIESLVQVQITVQCGSDAVLQRPAEQPAVSSSSSSSASSWGASYRSQLATALEALLGMVRPALFALCAPRVKAHLMDSFCQAAASQLQQQQQGWDSGPAIKQALLDMSAGLSRAGAALCAALPNRYFCNNPACRNAAGVSAGFDLVRGASCVCGGCVGVECAAGVTVAPQAVVAAR